MIHQQSLDFEILKTGNPKTIVFLDSSDYFENPDRPILQITPPGYSRYLVVNINARHINTLNSLMLGISQTMGTSNPVNLADGVWKLRYMICPYDKLYVQKYHLRTVEIRAKLSQITDYLDFSDCDVKEDQKIKLEYVDILLLLSYGEARAELGFPEQASDAYHKANKKVIKLYEKLTKRK